MPKYGGNNAKCALCGKTVYKLEEIIVEGSHLHKGCFKCDHCNRQLTISNFAAVNGKNYCKTHYIELFKTSGGSYKVFGDSGFKKTASGHLTTIVPKPEVAARAERRTSSSFNHVWTKKAGATKAHEAGWGAKLEGTPSKKSEVHHQDSIVVLGSANADLVMQAPRVPAAGETVMCAGGAGSCSIMPGGKGANQAAAAAKLAGAGSHVLFVGQLGCDANGAMIQNELEACGADLSCTMRLPCQSTGTAVVLVLPGGDNAIVVSGGANAAKWAFAPAANAALQSCGALLLQREIPGSANAEAAKKAQAGGAMVVLDAGGEEGPIEPALMACISVLSPNATELARLVGHEGALEGVEAITEAAKKLQAESSNDSLQVLVTLGSEGSLHVAADGEVTVVAADKVATVRDTTGAGDCFTAAWTVGILEGKSVEAAMKFAAAAAGLCVQKKGAMPSMPTRKLVDAAHA